MKRFLSIVVIMTNEADGSFVYSEVDELQSSPEDQIAMRHEIRERIEEFIDAPFMRLSHKPVSISISHTIFTAP